MIIFTNQSEGPIHQSIQSERSSDLMVFFVGEGLGAKNFDTSLSVEVDTLETSTLHWLSEVDIPETQVFYWFSNADRQKIIVVG